MNTLKSILSLYEAKGLDALIEDKDLWSNFETLKAALDDIPAEERENLQMRFKEIIQALSDSQKDLAQKMQDQLLTVNRVQANTEACISYSKASNTARKMR